MDRADAEAVIPKRFERQRLQRGPLLGKHRGDLALGGAVDPRIGQCASEATGTEALRAYEAQQETDYGLLLERVTENGKWLASPPGIALR